MPSLKFRHKASFSVAFLADADANYSSQVMNVRVPGAKGVILAHFAFGQRSQRGHLGISPVIFIPGPEEPGLHSLVTRPSS